MARTPGRHRIHSWKRPWIVAGGVLGPLLLVFGLARLSGAAASLLLNLEAPFTIALAVAMLGEHLSRREVRFPSAAHLVAALVTGSLAHGASIPLHLLAVRSLGAARQAAYFATAPFIGAVVAIPLLRERLPPAHVAAGALMAIGIAVIVRARHAHAHLHEPEEHTHAHVHEEHHAHTHEGAVTEPHSHVHRHTPLFHDHPHLPDVHHRHGH